MKRLGWAWTIISAAAWLLIAYFIFRDGPLIAQIIVVVAAAVIVITYWIASVADRLDLRSQRRFDALGDRLSDIENRRQ